MVALLADIPRWIERGENDQVRELARELEERLRASDNARACALQLTLMAATSVPFQVDDEEFPDEPVQFRIWRTVERGYPVMDRRALTDPTLRVWPRRVFRVDRTDEEEVVTDLGIQEGPENTKPPLP